MNIICRICQTKLSVRILADNDISSRNVVQMSRDLAFNIPFTPSHCKHNYRISSPFIPLGKNEITAEGQAVNDDFLKMENVQLSGVLEIEKDHGKNNYYN